MEERLQKIIARAGIASRRHAEQLIASGLVTVNGRVVTEPGTKADAARDHIKVSGKLLRPARERVYLALHKPSEVVSTMSDPEGRKSLGDFLRGIPDRVFPVGRLEYHASGLLLLTNDGEFSNRLLQAHHLPQTWEIKVKGALGSAEIEEITRATDARITRRSGSENPWYTATLAEARRDAVRNTLFRLGHPVEKMKRVRLGELSLGPLPPGSSRPLTPPEIRSLERAAKRAKQPEHPRVAANPAAGQSRRHRKPRISSRHRRSGARFAPERAI